MFPIVVASARLACSQGSAPAPLFVAPGQRETIDRRPVATVMDCAALANIQPFGLCRSLANPEVAEASAAAHGALMPRPCRPVPLGPWEPGSRCRKQAGMPLLTQPSTCHCAWAGVISVIDPGQDRVATP